MMKKLPAAEIHGNNSWRGYSLSELRFQRALTLVRMEMASEKLQRSTRRIDNQISSAVAGNIFLRLFSNINVAEYAAVALRTVRTVYRFWRSFKG